MMSPEIIAAASMVIIALAGLAQDLTNLSDSVGSGESAQPSAVDISAMTLNGAVDIATLYLVAMTAQEYYNSASNLVPSAEESAVKSSWNSPIVGALLFVESLTEMVGFGAPYAGEDVNKGLKQLAALNGRLDSALPDSSSWRGVSAQSYGNRVSEIQANFSGLAYSDKYLVYCAESTADLVGVTRLIFGILKSLLLLAYVIEKWSPEFRGFANMAAVLAVAAAVVLVGVVQLNAKAVVVSCLGPLAAEYRDY